MDGALSADTGSSASDGSPVACPILPLTSLELPLSSLCNSFLTSLPSTHLGANLPQSIIEAAHGNVSTQLLPDLSELAVSLPSVISHFHALRVDLVARWLDQPADDWDARLCVVAEYADVLPRDLILSFTSQSSLSSLTPSTALALYRLAEIYTPSVPEDHPDPEMRVLVVKTLARREKWSDSKRMARENAVAPGFHKYALLALDEVRRRERPRQEIANTGLSEISHLLCSRVVVVSQRIFLAQPSSLFHVDTPLNTSIASLAHLFPRPALLTGPPSSGKTHAIHYLAARLGASIFSLSLADTSIDVKTLLGTYVSSNGGFEWMEGALSKALRAGRWIVFDDIDRASMEMLVLIAGMTRRGVLPTGRDEITVGPIFATSTGGTFFGEHHFHDIHLAPLDKLAILSARFDIDERIAKLDLPLRDLIKWCKRDHATPESALLDAVDIFGPGQLEHVAETLGVDQEAAGALLNRRPVYEVDKHVHVGRITLPRKIGPVTPARFALTRPALTLLESIAAAVAFNEPLLLIGETGTGKTTSIQHLAHACGQSIFAFNLSTQTESSDLLGGFKPIDTASAARDLQGRWQKLFIETFSMSKNSTYIDAAAKALAGKKWQRLVDLWTSSARRAMTKGGKRRKLDSWQSLLDDIALFTPKPVFKFVEGPLVRALRDGHWILLDEVNLASPDVLEALNSILSGDLVLTSRGDVEAIPRHPNFRLFACMNPATDVGKKDLPPHLSVLFTRIHVPPPDDNREALVAIIEQYLDGPLVLDVADLYTDFKKQATAREIVDGSLAPHYSMRTLTRALSFAVNTPLNLRRAVAEGWMMAFMMALDPPSIARVQPLLERHLGTHPAASFSIPPGPLPPLPSRLVLTPSVSRKLVDLSRAILARYPVLIQGPTSSGKTSAIEHLARTTGHRFVRINNHEHTDLQEYLGTHMTDQSGNLVFQEGLLVTAVRQGHWIVLDELNLAPTDVLEALNRLLDDNRELLIPETGEIVKPHPQFMLFATQNPPGLYAGRKVLSRAFRNRFLEVHFDDVPNDELETILCERCQIAPSYARKIVQVFEELRHRRQTSRVFESKHSFATLRDLFRWAERGAIGYEQLARDGYMLLAERARNEEDKVVIKEVLEGVMKVALTVTYPVPAAEGRTLVWTSAMCRLYTLIHAALSRNEPVLLVGETGSGKTSICEAIAQAFSQQLISVNCHQNMETADLIGSQRPVRNRGAIRQRLESAGIPDLATLTCLAPTMDPALVAEYRHDLAMLDALFQWSPGPLVDAMTSGHLLLLDEVSLADDSVLERLNSVLEPGRTLVLAEKGGDIESATIVADDRFHVIATMNPGGDFGKKELSPALRNRFTEIWVPPVVDRNDLVQIINRPYAPAVLDFFTWFVERTGESGLGLRDILAWVQFIDLGLGFVHGGEMVFVDGLEALPSMQGRNAAIVREEAVLKLEHLAHDDEFVTAPPGVFSVGGFSLPAGPHPITPVSFHFSTPTTRLNTLRVLRACQLPKAILLEGSPGVGKTSLVSALAAVSGHRLERINLSDQTDLIDLFGSDLPMDGTFAWRNAAFLEAMQQGDWVLLDEMNLASQTVLEGLNAVLDHRGTVFIPELGRSFTRHPDFRVFAAQNPHAQGGGRKGLPKSFLNRFTKVYLQEQTMEDLEIICRDQAAPEVTSKMIIFNERIREASIGFLGNPWEFNLRDLLRWCDLAKGSDPTDYLRMLYVDRLRSATDRDTVRRIFTEVFGHIDLVRPAPLATPSYLRIGHSVVPGHTACRLTAESLLKAVELGWLAILPGTTGNETVHALAKATGNELSEFGMHPGVDASEILGSFEALGDTRFAWVDGQLVNTLRNGGWFLISEANLCNASVLDRLNSLCERDGVLVLSEKGGVPEVIPPHPSFRLFMTYDPKYGELSRAMRNRGVELYTEETPVIPRVDDALLDRIHLFSLDTDLAGSYLANAVAFQSRGGLELFLDRADGIVKEAVKFALDTHSDEMGSSLDEPAHFRTIQIFTRHRQLCHRVERFVQDHKKSVLARDTRSLFTSLPMERDIDTLESLLTLLIVIRKHSESTAFDFSTLSLLAKWVFELHPLPGVAPLVDATRLTTGFRQAEIWSKFRTTLPSTVGHIVDPDLRSSILDALALDSMDIDLTGLSQDLTSWDDPRLLLPVEVHALATAQFPDLLPRARAIPLHTLVPLKRGDFLQASIQALRRLNASLFSPVRLTSVLRQSEQVVPLCEIPQYDAAFDLTRRTVLWAVDSGSSPLSEACAIASRLAAMFDINSQPASLASLGHLWCQIGRTIIDFYVTNIPIDPAVRRILQEEVLLTRFELLHEELDAVIHGELLLKGVSDSHRLRRLRQRIDSIQGDLGQLGPSIDRVPDAESLAAMYHEVHGFDLTQIVGLISALLQGDLAREVNFQLASASFIQRLDTRYPADLVLPIVTAILCVRFGLQCFKRDVELQTESELVPALLAFPQADRADHLVSLPDGVEINLLRAGLGVPGQLDYVYDTWSAVRLREERDEAIATSLYRVRQTDEEREEEEFLQLFSDASREPESGSFPTHLVQAFHDALHGIFPTDVLTRVLSTSFDASQHSDRLDRDSLSYQIHLLARPALSGNFYRSPNVPEVRKAHAILSRLHKRLDALVSEWPEQMVLQHIRDRVDQNLQMHLTSPVAQVLTSLEALITHTDDWEPFANRDNSLASYRAELSTLIISWRKMELTGWSTLLKDTLRQYVDADAEWTLRLYGALLRAPGNVAETLPLLKTYLSSSTLGHFAHRLRTLTTFLPMVRSDVATLLHNVIANGSLFVDHIESSLSTQRKEVDKSITDFVKLASWKDVNVFALKASAVKSHRQLFKCVRKFKEILQQPVAPLLNLNAITSVDTALSVPQRVEVRPPGSGQRLRQLDLETTFDRFVRVVTPHIDDVAAPVEQLATDIIETSLELARATPSALTKANTKLVQNLASRKRKAFADLLKELKTIGFSQNLRADLLQRQQDPTWIASQAPLKSDSLADWVDRIEHYQARQDILMGNLRASLAGHHEDIPTKDLQRGIGFAESLYSSALAQRAALVKDLVGHDQFASLVSRMPNLASVLLLPAQKTLQHLIKLGQSLDEVEQGIREEASLRGATPDDHVSTLQIEVEALASQWKSINSAAQASGLAVYSSAEWDLMRTSHATSMRVAKVLDSLGHRHLTAPVARIALQCPPPPVLDARALTPEFSMNGDELIDSMLVIAQKTAPFVSGDSLSGKVVSLETLSKQLHLRSIYARLIAFVDSIATEHHRVDTAELFARLLPFARVLREASASIIHQRVQTLKATYKLSYVVGKILLDLAQKGFCKPQEESLDDDGAEGQEVEGTGMGTGTGDKNVSSEITEESQVEGLQVEEEEEEEQEEKQDAGGEDENAVSMDDDFAGDMGEGKEEDSKEDQGSEADHDETIDDVDPLDPGAMDEKFWQGESEDKKDEVVDAAQQESGETEMAAKDESKSQEKRGKGEHPDQDEEHQENPETEQAGDEAEDMNQDPLDPGETVDGPRDEVDVPEGDALDLPEDMNLDDAQDKAENEADDMMLSGDEGIDEDAIDDMEEDGQADEQGDDIDEAPEANGAPEDDAMETDQDAGQQELDLGGAGEDEAMGQESEIGQGQGGTQEQQGDAKAEDTAEVEDAPAGTGAASAQPQGAEGTDGTVDSVGAPMPSNSQQRDARSLGDIMKEIRRRRDEILAQQERDSQPQTQNQEAKQVEYVKEDEDAQDQALGPAGDEQQQKLSDLNLLDEEVGEDDEAPPPDENEQVQEPSGEGMDSIKFNSATNGSVEKAINQADVGLTDEEEEAMDHSRSDSEPDVEMDPVELQTVTLDTSGDTWRRYSTMTSNLSYALCEQLRLVLEPTLASRLQGDFRTGKRLNMRKIIPYIASEYTKDKIWLRRTKPSKREYQVLLSLDDSRSMSESHSVDLAYQTLALVCQALTKLEVGQVGIAKFGQTVDILHSFDKGFTDADGARVMESFKFDQHRTDVAALMDRTLTYLAEARAQQHSSSSSDLWQLEIIISDGVCQDHDKLRVLLRRAMEERVMVVFIILDSLNQQSSADASSRPSILSMQSVEYKMIKGEMQLAMNRYLDTFPFEFFVVLRDVEALPSVLGDTLRQWMARVSQSQE